MLQAVASHDVSLKAIVTELESVVDAYTTIATKKLKPVEFASATIATIAPQAMRMIAGKRHVPVLSVSVPKRPDCDYQGLPYVARLQPAVCFVGGINAPKQITVTDNYGKVCPCKKHGMIGDAQPVRFDWHLCSMGISCICAANTMFASNFQLCGR